ncbi:secretin N-terminal domain-containing protein [Calycomorphotria hydatis]|uniref:Bacterial type II/III secretion system short domain protein n=1 Tax=Calycomorphotria hydatis TaxID=2528027 RepID=A0A517T5G8_9PLAN|nr:secretin N-terminal domain-containing protein [Calycomorphotria hydatis]QDT63622.1 Bacterial type II/III secretion system short domain protein [Calycomorphotria hydatis]
MNQKFSPRACLIALVVFSVTLGVGQHAWAQPPGPGGGPQTPLMYLRDEGVQSELGISEEQRAELMDIVSRTFTQGGNMGEMFRKMRDAKTDEERDQLRNEMRASMQERMKEIEGEAQKVISGGQFARLKQIALQAQGSRALMQEDLQKQIGMTDEQRQKIEELNEQRSDALRELGRDADPAESQKLRDEYDTKIQDVLTEEQQANWKQQLGPDSEAAKKMAESRSSGRDRFRRGPGGDRNNGPGDRRFGRPPGEGPRGDRAERNGPPADAPREPGGAEPKVAVIIPEEEVPVGAEVMATFGSEAAAGGEQGTASEKISFNFRYAPWSDVLKLFAEVAGLTLDLNEVPPGTFNYYDSNSYTPTEAIDVLNGYLLPKGFILIRRDNFLVSLDIKEGIAPNLVPNVPLAELDQRGKNELLSVVIPLSGVEAEKAAAEASNLLGPQGSAAPLTASNSLVVTDIGSNVRRVRDLFAKVTLREGPTDIAYRSFVVRHIPVGEAERTIRNLFGIGTGVPNVSAAAGGDRDRDRSSRYRWGPPGRDDRDDRSQSQPAQQATNTDIKITSDTRTNTLLVSTTIARLKMIEQVLETIDVAGGGQVNATTIESTTPFLKVYKLEEADAGEVAKTLNALMPGVVVNEDGRNDLLHIFASSADQREVEKLIYQLDGMGSGQSVAVMPLATADPYSTSLVLRSLFAGDKDRAPQIEADSIGRRIMVRGTADQITQVRSLLTQLGENGGSGQSVFATGKGPIRTIPLGGRDPSELVPLIERLWKASGRSKIRVVIPNEESAPQPAEGVDATGISSRKEVVAQPAQFTQEEDSTSGPDDTELDAIFDNLLGPAESASPTPESKPEVQKPAVDPEVTVTVRGGQLMLLSEDEKMLDQLEQLVQSLMLSNPASTQWTVFYLRTADAATTATMLQRLFPDATIGGGLTTSLSSTSGGISPLAPESTLEIIPETRLNALFVRGPRNVIDQMEDVLKLLDSSELPESLRDRVPRAILVQHADAAQVASILRDVYADQMGNNNQNNQNRGGQRGGGRGGFNPFEAMMAGQAAPAAVQEARVTIGVDTQTSQIIVSANDATYNEIKRLVETLDESAREANRTVRVMSVSKENSLLIQQALGSVIPKVRVSTTGTPPATGSSSAAPSSNSSNNDDAAAQQMRDAFRQRMMERFRESGGGPPGGFGGGPPGGFGGEGFRGGDRGGFGGGSGRGGDSDRGRDRSGSSRGRR